MGASTGLHLGALSGLGLALAHLNASTPSVVEERVALASLQPALDVASIWVDHEVLEVVLEVERPELSEPAEQLDPDSLVGEQAGVSLELLEPEALIEWVDLSTSSLVWPSERTLPVPEVQDPPSAEPSPEKPAPSDQAPQPTLRPPPVYPVPAVRMGQEGVVHLRLSVDVAGLVTRVEVIASSGFALLDEAAREALSRWRFEARRSAGLPAVSTFEHRVRFSLSGR